MWVFRQDINCLVYNVMGKIAHGIKDASTYKTTEKKVEHKNLCG
jgi:hypothetical protein